MDEGVGPVINDADRLNLPPAGPDELCEIWDAVDRIRYYDRSGNRISMRDWHRLRAQNDEGKYIQVDTTTIGDLFVSTVWLGLDHGFRFWDENAPPLIFETMVFSHSTGESHDCRRWSTEAQALEGHRRMCEEVRLFQGLTCEP